MNENTYDLFSIVCDQEKPILKMGSLSKKSKSHISDLQIDNLDSKLESKLDSKLDVLQLLNEFIASVEKTNPEISYDKFQEHISTFIDTLRKDNIIPLQHWIIRVGDGQNFKNSKKPIWGINRGPNNNIKSTIQNKLTEGDLLWFLTPEQYGKKIIGMAEYTHYYDSEEEPLIKLNTYTNEELGWDGEQKWDIQIHYKNLYETEEQNISFTVHNPRSIIDYNTHFRDIEENLQEHYNNYKKYAKPKIF